MDEKMLLKSRMIDLAREAENGCYYTASHFLTLAEQGDLDALYREGTIGRYTLDGGFEASERRIALFGDPDSFGYDPTPPTAWLKIAPVAPKFADALTHRDFLGTVMGLGIKRELLGDIIIKDNIAYLYLLDTIAPYIAESLTRVKHTEVRVTAVDAPPDTFTQLPDETLVVTAGERLDATVAAVYNLSRQEALSLCEKGLVSINGRVTDKNAQALKTGVTVSVRGYGRFRYEGIRGDTRKGKLRVAVRIFS